MKDIKTFNEDVKQLKITAISDFKLLEILISDEYSLAQKESIVKIFHDNFLVESESRKFSDVARDVKQIWEEILNEIFEEKVLNIAKNGYIMATSYLRHRNDKKPLNFKFKSLRYFDKNERQIFANKALQTPEKIGVEDFQKLGFPEHGGIKKFMQLVDKSNFRDFERSKNNNLLANALFQCLLQQPDFVQFLETMRTNFGYNTNSVFEERVEKSMNGFKVGDYVYYDDKGDSCPTQIEKIGKKRIQVRNLDDKLVWVSPSSLVLQSEYDL